jgi:GDPmannose 4,6-dehydratase
MKKKKAFITGISGQDGSYLTEFLLKKNYEVHGLIRRSSLFNRERIEYLIQDPKIGKNLQIHYGDMCDGSGLFKTLSKVQPDEIYNLAAQSHVKISFEIPEYTFDTIGGGTLRILEIAKSLKNDVKIYNASSSEQYGNVNSKTGGSEKTIFKPNSPYASAKCYAHNLCDIYRDSYKIFICNGILFNHESPRRSENFVSRKISISISNIIKKRQKFITLGNLYAKRDWGYAKDYVGMMWKMLQKQKPENYVISSDKSYSVKQFVEKSFKYVNINIKWHGKGLNEIGYDSKTGDTLVKVSKEYFRPLDVDYLLGDSSKAKKELGWKNKTSLDNLIKIMIENDIQKN